MPYKPNTAYLQYSKINADSFFINKDNQNCPVQKCEIRQPDCQSNYTGAIKIDNNAPFGILAVTDFPEGWINQVCLICENQNVTRSIQIEVNQLNCNDTGNCQNISKVTGNNTKGQCSGALKEISNPKTIVVPFNPTS